MATITIRKIVDDLDSSEEGVATTPFAFEGVTYEIDLATANYVKLREFLEPFIKAARRTGGRATGRRIMMPGQTTETVEKTGGNGNGNGNGHAPLGPTRDFLVDIAAPRDASHNQLIRLWYAQQTPEVQAQLGVLHPKGSIRSSIVLAYQQAHGMAPADDEGEPGEPAAAPPDRQRINAMRDWYNGLSVSFRAAHPWVAGDEPGSYIAERYEAAREGATDAAEVAEEVDGWKTAEPAAEAPQTTRTELLPTGQTENALIRAWYAKQPYSWRATRPLADRGRIPATIRDAYFRRGEKTQKAKIDA